MSDLKMVQVAKVPGMGQAIILKDLLEAQSIPVIVTQEGAGYYFGQMASGPFGGVEILAPENLLEKAQEIVEEYYQGEYYLEGDMWSAETLRTLLEEQGITVIGMPEGEVNPEALLTDPLSQIMVAEEDFEKAQEVILEYFESLGQ